MSRRAKHCRWRHEELFGFPICPGHGRGCNGLGRHQTSREWKRACRRMDRWHAGRHDWAWNEAVLPW